MFVGKCETFRPAPGPGATQSDVEVFNKLWAPFETPSVKFKQYTRSAAGNERPAEESVRSPKVLLKCSEQLVHTCTEFFQHKDTLNFFLNRSRAIRQDFTIQSNWIETDSVQQLFFHEAMRVLARFAIVASAYLSSSEDDDKALDDSLRALLSHLTAFPEFARYQEYILGVRTRRPSVYVLALHDRLYNRFLIAFDKTTHLEQLALRRRLLPMLQVRSIATLKVALNGPFKVSLLTLLLKFDSEAACIKALQYCGLEPYKEEGCWLVMLKKNIPLKSDALLERPTWYRWPFLEVRDMPSTAVIDRILFDS